MIRLVWLCFLCFVESTVQKKQKDAAVVEVTDSDANGNHGPRRFGSQNEYQYDYFASKNSISFLELLSPSLDTTGTVSSIVSSDI